MSGGLGVITTAIYWKHTGPHNNVWSSVDSSLKAASAAFAGNSPKPRKNYAVAISVEINRNTHA